MPIRLLTLAGAFSLALTAGMVAGNAAVSGMNGLAEGYALPDVGDETASLAAAEAAMSEPAPAEILVEPVMLAETAEPDIRPASFLEEEEEEITPPCPGGAFDCEPAPIDQEAFVEEEWDTPSDPDRS